MKKIPILTPEILGRSLNPRGGIRVQPQLSNQIDNQLFIMQDGLFAMPASAKIGDGTVVVPTPTLMRTTSAQTENNYSRKIHIGNAFPLHGDPNELIVTLKGLDVVAVWNGNPSLTELRLQIHDEVGLDGNVLLKGELDESLNRNFNNINNLTTYTNMADRDGLRLSYTYKGRCYVIDVALRVVSDIVNPAAVRMVLYVDTIIDTPYILAENPEVPEELVNDMNLAEIYSTHVLLTEKNPNPNVVNFTLAVIESVMEETVMVSKQYSALLPGSSDFVVDSKWSKSANIFAYMSASVTESGELAGAWPNLLVMEPDATYQPSVPNANSILSYQNACVALGVYENRGRMVVWDKDTVDHKLRYLDFSVDATTSSYWNFDTLGFTIKPDDFVHQIVYDDYSNQHEDAWYAITHDKSAGWQIQAVPDRITLHYSSASTKISFDYVWDSNLQQLTYARIFPLTNNMFGFWGVGATGSVFVLYDRAQGIIKEKYRQSFNDTRVPLFYRQGAVNDGTDTDPWHSLFFKDIESADGQIICLTINTSQKFLNVGMFEHEDWMDQHELISTPTTSTKLVYCDRKIDDYSYECVSRSLRGK